MTTNLPFAQWPAVLAGDERMAVALLDPLTHHVHIVEMEAQLRTSDRIFLSWLAGLVERVNFHNDESGVCVLRIKARGQRELVTVVGTLPEVRVGEWPEAHGCWTVNKEYNAHRLAAISQNRPRSTDPLP